MNKEKKENPKKKQFLKEGVKVKKEKIKKKDLISKFYKKHNEDKEVIELSKFLRSKKFERVDAEDGFVGYEMTFEENGKIAFGILELESYINKETKETACIIQTSMLSFERTDITTYAWVAPIFEKEEFDKLPDERKNLFLIENIDEYRIDKKDLKVKKVNGNINLCSLRCVLDVYMNIWELIFKLINCLVSVMTAGYYWWLAYLVDCLFGFELYFIICNFACSCCCNWWCRWYVVGCYCHSTDYNFDDLWALTQH